MLEACNTADRVYLESRLHSAWEAINNGTVDDDRRKSYWRHWQRFTAKWNTDEFLSGCSDRVQAHILCAFADGVRKGDFGRGRRIAAQSVDRAIRAIGQTFQLAGRRDPTKVDGSRERILPLRRLTEGYRRSDPPPKPQLAIPVDVIEHLQATATPGTTKAAIADLATLAFFFLLRVGEYTMPSSSRKTRTVQFRVMDVTFYRDGCVIPCSAPLDSLMTADGVALCISNQKNGTRGETIFHHALPGRRTCPVCAAARRVASVMAATGDASQPLSRLAASHGGAPHATASMVRIAIRGAVLALGLSRRGIHVARVGSHSLRAGGAMAMKLNGCDLITIMKTGRWTSLTFLTYIHNQIAHLGANITHHMARPVPFFSFAAAI